MNPYLPQPERVTRPASLTVILPSVDPGAWQSVYDSLGRAVGTSGHKWELFVIGPRHGQSPGPNFKFVFDEGSPCHCAQRALLASTAEFVTWAADDCLFLENSLCRDFPVAAFVKHIEGSPDRNDRRWLHPPFSDIASLAHGEVGLNPDMVTDAFWRIDNHPGRSPHIPPDWLMMVQGVFNRHLLVGIGGWDTTRFEVLAGGASMDLGVRLQRMKVPCVLWPHIVMAAGYVAHRPGSPVVDAFNQNDMPAYQRLYDSPDCTRRIAIPIDEADRQGARWKRKYPETAAATVVAPAKGIDLTVILPTINPASWPKAYNSIAKAVGEHTWEVVAIGPNPGTFTMDNFRFIQDAGSLCHCFQRAMLEAKGGFVTWTAEDVAFLPNALGRTLDADLIVCKYTEGSPDLNDQRWKSPPYRDAVPHMRGAVGASPSMLDDGHWTVGYHHDTTKSPYLPDSWLVLSQGIVRRSALLEIGGWDTATFEITSGGAMADLSNRLQRGGYSRVIWSHLVMACGYDPIRPDNPISAAYRDHDQPAYKRIYAHPNCVDRVKLPIRDEDRQSGVWARTASKGKKGVCHLSFLMPSIDPAKWSKVWDSITASVNGRYPWELVAIGPIGPEAVPVPLADNIRFIHDHGDPVHCTQRALIHARGEFVTWIADDQIALPGAFDRDFECDCIFTKFVEGSPDPKDETWKRPPYSEIVPYMHGAVGASPAMLHDFHWTAGFHQDIRARHVPGEWLALAQGIFRRQVIMDIGGFDTGNFETLGMASFELGVRLQRSGQKCILWPHITLAAGYDPIRPDSPVHRAAKENDLPAYTKIYNDPKAETRTAIGIARENRYHGHWRRRWPKVELAIVLPSIDPKAWAAVYDSIWEAVGKHSWELVIIGPTEDQLPGINCRFIQDKGSPCHCLQRVLLTSDAEYLTWIADDSVLLPGSLARSFDADAAVCKYIEGSPDPNDPKWLTAPYCDVAPFARGKVGASPAIFDDAHWQSGFHPHIANPNVPDSLLVLLLGIVRRETALKVGGLDTRFETLGFATIDLGMRMQRAGMTCILWPHMVQAMGYEAIDPLNPDVWPLIMQAMNYHDRPWYHGVCKDRPTTIAVDEADREPGVWARRFK